MSMLILYFIYLGTLGIQEPHSNMNKSKVLHSLGGNAMCLRAVLVNLAAALSATVPSKMAGN